MGGPVGACPSHMNLYLQKPMVVNVGARVCLRLCTSMHFKSKDAGPSLFLCLCPPAFLSFLRPAPVCLWPSLFLLVLCLPQEWGGMQEERGENY